MEEKKDPNQALELEDEELDQVVGGEDVKKPAQCPRCRGWVDVPVYGSASLRCPHCDAKLHSYFGELEIERKEAKKTKPQLPRS